MRLGAIAGAACLGWLAVNAAPTCAEVFSAPSTLSASDGAAGDEFGYASAVSADGNTVLIGAPYASIGANTAVGAAYVYTRSGNGWLQQKLAAPDGVGGDNGGNAVALSADGTLAFVGVSNADTPNTDQGAVYIYRRGSSGFAFVQKLVSANAAQVVALGYALAVSRDGSVVVAGAPGTSIGANLAPGAAFVFVNGAAGWSETQRLLPSQTEDGEQFGSAVAISGDAKTIVVGAAHAAVGANTEQGKAVVFQQAGSSWSQQSELVAAQGTAFDHGGVALAVSQEGCIVLMGGPDTAVGPMQVRQGAVEVFRCAPTWHVVQQLTSSDGADGELFGSSVALSAGGGVATIGAPGSANGHAGSNWGAAYRFRFAAGAWNQTQKMTCTDTEQEACAFSLALSGDGDVLVLGATNRTVNNNTLQGAAFLARDGELIFQNGME